MNQQETFPRDRWLALREALEDGVLSLHSAIEAAAVRDAQRRMEANSLQGLARGVEVLEKTVWVLNALVADGQFPPEKTLKVALGHNITALHGRGLERIESLGRDLQERYEVEFLRDDACLQEVLALSELFAQQGRYHHLTTAGAWLHLRQRQVTVLQRLLRSLARQAIDAQRALDVGVVAHGRTLTMLAELSTPSLAIPAPLPDGCACADLDLRRVAIYTPVDDATR